MYLGTVEMLLHAVIATIMLDPNFDFQFYIWPTTILISLNPSIKFARSGIIAVLAIVLFAYISTNIYTDRSSEYNPAIIEALLFGNIVFSEITMILIGIIVRMVFKNKTRCNSARARSYR